MENILPSLNTKTHLSKGLQSTSPLVQHCMALALAKCLLKYLDVQSVFQNVIHVLGEAEDGQWCKRWREIEKEARKRVPDFQVVVAFAQQTANDESTAEQAMLKQNAIRRALMAESAQRLLWLYHRCLPSLVAEARFDVGKLLQNFILDPQPEAGGLGSNKKENADTCVQLRTVRQLHVLRLLKESDQFLWSGKPCTYFHLLVSNTLT